MCVKTAIESIKQTTHEEWDAMWSMCDYSTFFHGRSWAQAWSTYTDSCIMPSARILVFDDGKKALVPICTERRCNGLFRSHLSSPAGTYGGWITTDPLTEDHVREIEKYLLGSVENLVLRINPFNQSMASLAQSAVKKDETFVLDLNKGFERICDDWSRSHKLGLKKAYKYKIDVHIATDINDWSSYYEIYQDSLRRWGNDASSNYKWKLFESLAQQNNPNIELRLATYDGQPVSGVILLYAKQHVVAWHMSTSEDYFKVHAPVILMHDAIQAACERNLRWFDFNPSGWHEGVRTFKQRFGAQELPASLIFTQTRWARITEDIAGTIKRAIQW